MYSSAGALLYTCRDPEDPSYDEASARTVVYVKPDTQRFLQLSPKYFYGVDDDSGLEVTFRWAL